MIIKKANLELSAMRIHTSERGINFNLGYSSLNVDAERAKEAMQVFEREKHFCKGDVGEIKRSNQSVKVETPMEKALVTPGEMDSVRYFLSRKIVDPQEQ